VPFDSGRSSSKEIATGFTNGLVLLGFVFFAVGFFRVGFFAAGVFTTALLGSVFATAFAVTVLSAAQRTLAGRFAAAGRPGARLLLGNVPHQRGEASGALIPAGGLAAFEAEVTARIPAADHILFVGHVLAVPYVAEAGEPLIRFRGGYFR